MSGATTELVDEAWERLQFDLDVRSGFWLTLVVGTDLAGRAELRELARTWCRAEGQPFRLHQRGVEDLPQLAVDLLARHESDGGLHWILADAAQPEPDRWLEAAGRLMLAMNERREAYRRRLGAGVVIEGQPGLVRELRMLAPDLFSVRAAVLELGGSPDPLEESSTGHLRERTASFPVLRLAGDSRRAEERVERLRSAGVEAPLLVALDRLAGTLHWEDRLARAVVVADEQLALVERCQRRHGSARWLLHARARALYRRGSITAKAGQWTAGTAYLEEAAALLRSLSAADALAVAYRRLLARVLRWLWWTAAQRRDQAQALHLAHETVALRRELVEAEPQDAELERLLVHHLSAAASQLSGQGHLDEARELLREARRRAEARAQAAPRVAVWIDELVDARGREGEICLIEGDLRGATERFREAREDARRWSEALPEDLGRLEWLVRTLAGISGRMVAAAAGGLGRDCADEAQEALDRLGALGAEPFVLARLGLELGQARALLASSEGDHAEALAVLRAVEAAATPFLTAPEAPRPLLREGARVAQRVAREALALDRSAEALAALVRAEVVLARSAALAPPSISDLGALRQARLDLARQRIAVDDLPGAVAAARQAVAAAEEAGWRFPGHTRVKPELFTTLRLGAELLADAGDLRAARDMLEEAALVGRDLIDQGGQRLLGSDELARVHLAAARLARRVGDGLGIRRHEARLRALVQEGAVDTGILDGLDSLELGHRPEG